MEEINISDFFNNDPIRLMGMIGKSIEVEMCDNKTYKGLLYCVDPVTKNLVLVNKTDEEHYDTDLLLGSYMKNLRVIDDDVSDDVIFKSWDKLDYDPVELNKKRSEIKEWLTNHYIDVIEDGTELKIGADLIIYPPYSIENCISSNTIILERISTILSKMKDDEMNNTS